MPVNDLPGYMNVIDNLYFLFHEGPSDRLDGQNVPAFSDVNDLRTDLRHDVDHGKEGKPRAKRRKVGGDLPEIQWSPDAGVPRCRSGS